MAHRRLRLPSLLFLLLLLIGSRQYFDDAVLGAHCHVIAFICCFKLDWLLACRAIVGEMLRQNGILRIRVITLSLIRSRAGLPLARCIQGKNALILQGNDISYLPWSYPRTGLRPGWQNHRILAIALNLQVVRRVQFVVSALGPRQVLGCRFFFSEAARRVLILQNLISKFRLRIRLPFEATRLVVAADWYLRCIHWFLGSSYIASVGVGEHGARL